MGGGDLSSCPHIVKHRRTLTKTLCNVIYNVIFPNNESARTIHAKYVRCEQCKTRLNALMCACCQCSTFACLTHMRAHFSEAEHSFAVSVETGFIYCKRCGDFVYDRRMERARRDAENSCRRSLNLSTRSIWYPDTAVVDVCHGNPARMIRFSRSSRRGLRGLVNLGNTCFMNCIIQAIVHTPHLKDYFLTNQHHCNSSPHSSVDCIMCELSNIFQEFYKGDITPYKPSRFLKLVWRHERHLAGYEQQDAHEFFMAALNVLHRHSGSMLLFYELNFRFVSTTFDPFWDISLDVAQEALLSPYSMSTSTSQQVTLEDCLRRYIKPEHLGETKCARCETSEESTKQFTLNTLPMVACFHLKRFEHSLSYRKKMDIKVKYPQIIDMTPFTTAFRERLAADGTDRKTSIAGDLLTRNRNKYELFAVVNHTGTMESGHYTCYIRHQHNQWFQCDDQTISKAPVENVLSSQGYLLFYHKCHSDYY
ncbi:unnamed protein product [Gongylonema pulchrum]|uniref:Ubiquitin carboxyl-terminal hydrolase n=1 Tax=Gongylonema pulchrum TaxID=637853 RepID=A0A183E1G5_9BILA|nr:unnamed protein product [Gongylonema pulchrum]